MDGYLEVVMMHEYLGIIHWYPSKTMYYRKVTKEPSRHMTETINGSHCHRPAQCWHKGTWPKWPWWQRWRTCIWTQQHNFPLTKAKLTSLTTECPCQKQTNTDSLIQHHSFSRPSRWQLTNWPFPIPQGLAFHSKRNWQMFQRWIILSCLQGLGQHHCIHWHGTLHKSAKTQWAH